MSTTGKIRSPSKRRARAIRMGIALGVRDAENFGKYPTESWRLLKNLSSFRRTAAKAYEKTLSRELRALRGRIPREEWDERVERDQLFSLTPMEREAHVMRKRLTKLEENVERLQREVTELEQRIASQRDT